MKLPFTFCSYVLTNQHLIEPLRLFLHLKHKTTTGRLLLPDLARTQKKHFNTLKNERWLNVKGGVIFLRKLATVSRYYKLKGKSTAAVLQKHLTDRNTFTGYLAAVVFKAINKKNKWKKGKKKEGTPAAVSGRGNSTCAPLLPKIIYSNAVSVRYFARHLGISIGKAHRLKQLASQYKFIKIRAKEREFEFYQDGKLISPVAQQLPAIHFDFPGLFGRVYKKNGQLFYRQPDQIFATV